MSNSIWKYKLREKKIVALTGGSTGWHIFPLLSLYNYLKEDNKYDFLWVWEEESLEEETASKNHIEFLHIPAWKFRRYFDVKNFFEPLKNITWIFYWIYYILKYKIDLVFSKWGYVSIPLCIAAFILRKEIYIHESDIIAWKSNKFISKLATKVFYTFPNELTESGNPKYIVSWQILNPQIIDSVKSLEIEENEILEVLIVGGSQWSRAIFESMLKIIPKLQDIKFTIILWDKNLQFKDDFKKFSNVAVYEFVTQRKMGEIMTHIDIAVTRAWATTLWELTFFGIHSIIVPLPNSAGNHQEENAKYFEKVYWSDILWENNLDEKLLSKLIKYSYLRKSWLNLWWFFNALKIIDKEIF